MEIARCMLAEKKMPKYFWAEAVNTTVYLLNRLPNRELQDMTPFEAWKGIKPSTRHLKVFGSVCYTHVPDAKRGKLDNNVELCILLSYSTAAKGYKVYNVRTKKKNDISSNPIVRAGYFSNIELTTDSPVLKTRSLAKVYEQCNFALVEPSSFKEEVSHETWIFAMEEELAMINKNDSPKNIVVEEFRERGSSETQQHETRQGDDSLGSQRPKEHIVKS
ncbi:uncharacterized protein LOC124894578, partial [Capsicum annuum]|uniref:uncharacterized protein LOC124894578 n=1 Tax=Capsicum annuum TaxID=4072 RepID=UPI001FB06574